MPVPENVNESGFVKEQVRQNPERIRLHIGEALGSGAQGDVFHAELFIFQENPAGFKKYPCVAKRLKNSDHSTIPVEFDIQELITADISSSVESGLLRLIGIYTVNDVQYAILPKCDATLENCIPHIRALESDNPALFQTVITNFFHSMLNGLENLYEKEIIHRDMKPANICFREQGFVLLDFGCAITKEDFQKRSDEIQGTAFYLAPEMTKKVRDFPFACDIYALGQILRQLLGKDISFQHFSEQMPHIYAKIIAYEKEKKEAGNTVDHQSRLQSEMTEKNNFDDCINFIVDAMCETLPERRPELATLKSMFSQLLLHSSSNKIDQLDLAEFYFNMTQPPVTAAARETALAEIDSLEGIKTPPRRALQEVVTPNVSPVKVNSAHSTPEKKPPKFVLFPTSAAVITSENSDCFTTPSLHPYL